MGFSSMPVPRDKILEIACTMCTETACKPCVIALVGRRPPGEPPLSDDLKAKSDQLKAEGSLLEAAGAPFGKLFPGTENSHYCFLNLVRNGHYHCTWRSRYYR